MSNPFVEIGLVFILATVLGVGMRFFKQPLILAYILTGLALGFLGITKVTNPETLTLLSQFGIAFLLFMVGLELKIADLRQIGRIAFLAAVGQVVFTFLVGFLLVLGLGFSLLAGIYIALSLTFSSTIIVIKLLSEKNDLASLSGKIAVSLLLVQDFVVIVALMFLAGFKSETPPVLFSFVLLFIKGLAFFLVISFLIKRLIPIIFRHLAKNQELLFLTAVTWCFLLASISLLLGFSLEIGAFLAGVSLSSLPYHYQISSRIKPLRDLFITLFFVGLGTQMVLAPGLGFLLPAIILSAFILIIKPLIIMLLMGVLGFRKRTSFLTAVSLAQVSEFSLILMAMGLSLKHVTSGDVSLVTAVSIITIAASTYLILGGQKIYRRFASLLSFLEIGHPSEKRLALEKVPEDHIVLIGCNRMGGDILELLKKKEDPYVVLDFNPEVVRWLEAQSIPCLFGDSTDEEILNQLNLEKARIVVSTIPDVDDNLALISKVKVKNPKTIVVTIASFPEEEEELYRAGADYVVLPHLLGGKHVAHILSEHADNLEEYLSNKRKVK